MELQLNRIPEYYHKYVNLVHEKELKQAFDAHQHELLNILKDLPAEKWDHSYAPGKWSIKEMVQHIIDTDRVFNYRALSFSRGDNTPLPGFDEVPYAANSEANRRTGTELMEELKAVQLSEALMFASFSDTQLERSGVANDNEVYVRGIGFIIVGHTRHHLNVLKERYL